MVMRIIDKGDPPDDYDFADDGERIRAWSPRFVTADDGVHFTMYTQRPNTDNASTKAATMRVVMSAQFYKYDRQLKQLYMPDGTICNYIDAGVNALGEQIYALKSFEDLFGNRVELLAPVLDPNHSGWTLVTVRQHFDNANTMVRDIVLTKDGVGRVRSIAYGAKVWEYEYGFQYGTDFADITQVTEPEGLTWTFD